MKTIYLSNSGCDIESEKLLPCPFCGGNPDLIFIGNNWTKKRSVIVKCKSCRVQRKNSANIRGEQWLADISTQQWNSRATKLNEATK